MNKNAALLTVLGLLFIWSIPDVIALRHLLMALAIVLLASMSPWSGLLSSWRASRLPVLLLGLFTVWLLVQAIFVSDETRWALGELRSQWLKAWMALFIGSALAVHARSDRMLQATTVTTLLAAVLFTQTLIALGQSVAWWFRHGELLRQVVPLTGGKLEMSYIVNMLLAALTVHLLYRASGRGSFLRLPVPAVLSALAIALASGYLPGARNGFLGTLFLSISALALYSIDRHRRDGLFSVLATGTMLACLIAVFAVISVRSDPRWTTLDESARLGWDIDRDAGWLDSSHVPMLADGRGADTSAYQRVAFIRASLRLIGQNPLGVGYGRNAFAHALGVPNAGHAHSGFMDLGIGGGIPAMVLWVAFIASLMAAGWRRHFHNNDPHGLLLLLIATGYMGRMILDSVNRDHMLQIFMFLVGYLLAVSPVKSASSVPIAPGPTKLPPP